MAVVIARTIDKISKMVRSQTSLETLRSLSARVTTVHRNTLIFLLGGPGSGKGAVCEHLARNGWVTLSTGELLRKMAVDDDALNATLSRGDVVDARLSAHAVLSHLASQNPAPHSIGTVIDGFPRNIENAYLWREIGAPRIPALFLDCEDSVLRQRLLKRGREDDDAHVVEHRIQFHRRETPKIWDLFEKDGLAAAVDGHGHIDAVCRRVDLALQNPPFSDIRDFTAERSGGF